VTDRSGCGLTELTVLQVVDELSAAGGGEAGSAEVLDEVDRRIGLGPSYAYPMVCDLVMPWVIPVTLLAMNGLPFDRTFPKPAPAWHTECRLSGAGKLIAAAEAGAMAPVPAAIINGTWWRGAAQPPLDPPRVIAALRRLIVEPGVPDSQLLQIVGRPVSLTGSELSGDFGALAQGERVMIRESPRITRTDAAVPPAPAEPPRPRTGPVVLRGGTGRPEKPAHLIIDAVPATSTCQRFTKRSAVGSGPRAGSRRNHLPAASWRAALPRHASG